MVMTERQTSGIADSRDEDPGLWKRLPGSAHSDGRLGQGLLTPLRVLSGGNKTRDTESWRFVSLSSKMSIGLVLLADNINSSGSTV